MCVRLINIRENGIGLKDMIVVVCGMLWYWLCKINFRVHVQPKKLEIRVLNFRKKFYRLVKIGNVHVHHKF